MVVAYASYLAESGHQVVLKVNHIDSVFKLSPLVIVESLRFSGKIGTIISVLTSRCETDIVIADIIAMALFLSVKNKKRVIYFAQDYNENSYTTFVQKIIIRLMYAICLSCIKVPVVSVSDELAQLFKHRFGSRPRVVYNGVDLSTFYFDPSEDLLREKGNRKTVLLFSRRDSRKGFDLALSTVAKLVNTYFPALIVWTVGEHLNDGEVPCHRHDFGYVGETELRQIMSSADLFLYPSRNEGFPLMVLEAFACKCPVVTTEAVPYAIDGDNALVARIEDVNSLTAKGVQILTDHKIACELTERAYKFVVNYSLKTYAEKFELILMELLKKDI